MGKLLFYDGFCFIPIGRSGFGRGFEFWGDCGGVPKWNVAGDSGGGLE